MTYEEALTFIHGAYGTGEKRGLENMHAMLSRLGDPHRRLKAVHVAGTNGKGSVCAFLQAALRVAGYRTGLYTSPFLRRYNERIRMDGVPISDGMLARVATEVAAVVMQLRREGVHPTEFEIGTAIAFCTFAQAGLDIAVIEVGLGGRLDPTNVITPEVSLIAAIGLDHTKALGNTVESIAREKAGIVKPGVPVVLSGQNGPGVRRVIAERCEALAAPLVVSMPLEGQALGLNGVHQADNAGAALSALKLLNEKGFEKLTEEAIYDGFARAKWPGRLQWLGDSPPVLLDGAHNVQAAQTLTSYIQHLPKARTVLVAGMMQDKDWQAITGVFAPCVDAVVAVAVENARALPAQTLADAFVQEGIPAHAAASVPEALAVAQELATAQGRVVVAGSLYLVGEALEALRAPEDLLLQEAKA